MKRLHFFFMSGICLPGIFFALCLTAGCQSTKKAGLRVVSWNLQTFFDGVTDGSEYAQFKGSGSRWSQKKYMDRLERLSAALRAFDADLVVLEELEKAGQLQDIYNQLSGTFRFSSLYRYGAFAAAPGAAIGVGVLSRFPLSDARVHALDIGSEGVPQPALRPLLELCLERDGRKLTLFVCHWKSKLGAESGIWRLWQERLLADCMAQVQEEGGAALACGDFNQDIAEFSLSVDGTACVQEANLALRGSRGPLPVYSPWLGEGGGANNDGATRPAPSGSYCYKGALERIDHFFASGGAVLTAFTVEQGGDWADSAGRPVRYDPLTGRGWSDHLPISCLVAF